MNSLKLNMRELLLGNIGESNPTRPPPLEIQQKFEHQKAPPLPNQNMQQNEYKSRF